MWAILYFLAEFFFFAKFLCIFFVVGEKERKEEKERKFLGVDLGLSLSLSFSFLLFSLLQSLPPLHFLLECKPSPPPVFF